MGAPVTQGTPNLLRFAFEADHDAFFFRSIGMIELANDQATDLIQHTRKAQMGKVPVDPVGLLARVLQEKNHPAKIGLVRCSQKPEQAGHVSADESSLDAPRNDRF